MISIEYSSYFVFLRLLTNVEKILNITNQQSTKK